MPCRTSGQADARFDGRSEESGHWTCRRELPERWTITCGPWQFELKRTDFGHVGLFPEQVENWVWIGERVRAAGRPLRVMNLFAYTGGSTLAAAAAAAETVHVDAAKNTVAWARRNAELSGLSAAPIRWIAEDALKFVKRELRRGNRYDAVILDPPSYGHGPRGEVWRLSKHLPRLLSLCGELTAGRARVPAVDLPHARLRTGHARPHDPRRPRWPRAGYRRSAVSSLRGQPGVAQRHRGAVEAGVVRPVTLRLAVRNKLVQQK